MKNTDGKENADEANPGKGGGRLIYEGLEQMPIFYGDRAKLMKRIELRFVDATSKAGYNLVDFPEVMPEKLVDTKFLKEDWRIIAPTGERFVLTPEITALYSDLLGQYPGNKALRKITYVSTCYRENRFKQLGLEAIDGSEEADILAVATAFDFLSGLGLAGDVEVAVNDLNYLRRTIARAGIRPEYQDRALKALDNSGSRLRKGLEFETDFSAQMQKCGADSPTARKLMDIVVSGRYPAEPPTEFMRVFEAIGKKTGCRLDASLARGLSYYNCNAPRESAVIFEIYSKTDLSQICGGGRYDGMPGRFNPALAGTELDRGIGFAFGLERVVEVVADKYGSAALETLK